MNSSTRILAVDDEEVVLYLLKESLQEEGYSVTTTQSPEEAIHLLTCEDFHLMFTDLNLPGISGLTLLEKAKSLRPAIEVILITGYGTIETAVESMRRGAYDYMVKPLNVNEIRILAHQAMTHARLRKELDIANELHQLKDDFIGYLSHELRTPLSVIHEASQTLQKHVELPPTEQVGKLLKQVTSMILQNSDRVLSILSDLADTFRSGRKSMVLNCSTIDLCQILNECAESVKTICQEKNIRLQSSCPQDQCVNYEGDPVKMRQAVVNLLTNAVKFTPSGGKVSLDLRNKGESIVITVADTGVGIPKEHLEKIFEKFYQVKESRSDISPGFGLGLSLVREIVQAHGGEISVRSEPGKGTVFEIVLFIVPKSK